uniref:CCHC-type domain-containing protein n=1 Tax=Oryza glaberrima TaxID=4538 RepID=I1QU88_ORYGL
MSAQGPTPASPTALAMYLGETLVRVASKPHWFSVDVRVQPYATVDADGRKIMSKGGTGHWVIDSESFSFDFLMESLRVEFKWGSNQSPSVWYFNKNLGEDVRLIGDADLPDIFEMYATEARFHLLVAVLEESMDVASVCCVHEPIAIIPPENPSHNDGSGQAATNVGGSAQPTTVEADVREPDMFDNTAATGIEAPEVEVTDEDPQVVRVLHDPENPNIVKNALFPDMLQPHHSRIWYICGFGESNKCNYLTNNVSESFNAQIRNLKGLHPHELVDSIRELIMEKMATRRDVGNKMDDGIIPGVMKQLNDATSLLKVVKIARSDDGHALAWICSSGGRIQDFVSPYYSVQMFRTTYAGRVPPMTDRTQWPVVDLGFKVHVPKQKRGAGRPRVQTIRGFLEPGRKRVKCKRCKRFGHFEKTCKLAEPADADDMSSHCTPQKGKRQVCRQGNDPGVSTSEASCSAPKKKKTPRKKKTPKKKKTPQKRKDLASSSAPPTRVVRILSTYLRL